MKQVFVFASIVSALLGSLSTTANAAIVQATGQIQGPRIESGVAIFSVGAFGSGCGSRAWVDLSTSAGRASYNTALIAFAMGRAVAVRVNTDDPKVFGECKLYDIAIV
ncbi:hypothetical protein [Roseateles sp. MS654]|uniref:hypothetical protein n=1 Tax=Roseateles sp. MS654 TaxID=3412685 RepID=UPI003C2B1339